MAKNTTIAIGDNKKNKQWVWLAVNAVTREMVGVYINARDEQGSQGLWNSLPPVTLQCAIAYTDFWAAYVTILPSTRHRMVGKETGKASYIEGFNNAIAGVPTLSPWRSGAG